MATANNSRDGIRPTPGGRWKVELRLGGRGSRKTSRTFDRKRDAERWRDKMRTKKQLGDLHRPDPVTLAEFFETYWELHAIPNLGGHTRDAYKSAWNVHLRPRLGRYELTDITPGVVSEFNAQLKHAGVGPAVAKKAFALLGSVLSYAVVRELVDHNTARAVTSPRYDREREPVIFLPPAVEEIRARLEPAGATLVSLLGYSGPRPEEALRLRVRDVGEEAVYYDGRKTRQDRHTPLLAPLAQDLREWRLASGRRGPNAPLIPAHDGGHWQADDWRNWRRRVWQSWLAGDAHCPHTADPCPRCGAHRLTPEGTRPRDLRSSYVTVQVYAGVPLTTIARWCGTSVAMIDKHYSGVIANWDGRQIPADAQILQARRDRQQSRAL